MKKLNIKKQSYKNTHNNSVTSEYKKLIMLKKAFYIGDDKETNLQMLLDEAQNQALNEIYLIRYLVNTVLNLPEEIHRENNILINFYNSPDKYRKQYRLIKKLYQTNPVFMRTAGKICSELDLLTENNRRITNLVLYALCFEDITAEIKLNPENIVLNLHILQNLLYKSKNVDFKTLSETEQKIVLYLANGYTPDDIISEKIIADTDAENQLLRTIIYDLLPVRCRVKSLCQAMAVIFMGSPYLCSISGALQLLEKLDEKGE